MEFTTEKIADLVHDPENPRAHSKENISAIKNSIKTHGQVEPLVVQKSTKMVIAGNARLGVMREMGMKKVKVVMLDVSDTDARKLSISLNRSGELASWNEGVLASHLEALALIDDSFFPESLGFSGEEMSELLASFGGDVDAFEFAPPEDICRAPAGALQISFGGDVDAFEFAPPEEDSVDEKADDFDDFSEDDSVDEQPSNVRMVQLFFNDDTIEAFQSRVRFLSKVYGTSNITDTVFQCIENAYNTEEIK